METCQAYSQRAKEKHEMMMVRGYGDATKEIMDLLDKELPEKDIESYTTEDIDRIWNTIDEKKRKYAEIVRKKGKNCPEYGSYRAYHDYQTKLNSIKDGIESRLAREKAKRDAEDEREKKVRELLERRNKNPKKKTQG